MQNEQDNNQLPKSGTSNTLPTLKAVNVYEQAEQMRVQPRQVSTGATRGQQEIQGTQIVRDANGVVRVVIGYDEDGF